MIRPRENADVLKEYRADQEVDRKRSNCFLDDFKDFKRVEKIEKWDDDDAQSQNSSKSLTESEIGQDNF